MRNICIFRRQLVILRTAFVIYNSESKPHAHRVFMMAYTPKTRRWNVLGLLRFKLQSIRRGPRPCSDDRSRTPTRSKLSINSIWNVPIYDNEEAFDSSMDDFVVVMMVCASVASDETLRVLQPCASSEPPRGQAAPRKTGDAAEDFIAKNS